MQTPSSYTGKIKIFLDGADRATMIEMAKNPKVQGFTTNPSLMKKAGVRDYPGFCKEILGHLGGKPVSFEVFADEMNEMKRQAHLIADWELKGNSRKQIYVKIPIMNSKGESCIPLIRELSHTGVALNVTAIYTLKQVWETCDAVRGGAPSIVSVFAGRIGDTGRDPIPMMRASAEICSASGDSVELLWASTREALNIAQAEETGCKIITAPADLIKKLPNFNRDLLEVSLDTVRTFKKDSEEAGFSL